MLHDSKESLQKKILLAVNKLNNATSCTLGPKGRTVILKQKDKRAFTTKDGITVARYVKLEDPIENSIIEIVRQSAEKTVELAGDGTTSTIVLANSILEQAQKYLTAGVPAVEIKRGMERAVEEVIKIIRNASIPIKSKKDIENIAIISANGDKTIGELIALAVDSAGKDGGLLLKDSRSIETRISLIEGFRFDKGYITSYFINDENEGKVKLHDPLIFVTDFVIQRADQIVPAMELAARAKKPFILIAEEIEQQALAFMVSNTLKAKEGFGLYTCAIRAPGYGEERRNILQDIAINTGATFFSRETCSNLSDVKLGDLGSCDNIEVSKVETVIVNGSGEPEKIEERIEQIKREIQETESLEEAEVLQKRITRLASGIVVIFVGGATEVEAREKKDRIEDAVEAVRSAQVEGMSPGGGIALLRASKFLQYPKSNILSANEKIGYDIIRNAIKRPFKQIIDNAGIASDVILDKVYNKLKNNEGYNSATFKYEKDMIKSGIIDPTKVIIVSLQNAASVAAALLMSSYCIVE